MKRKHKKNKVRVIRKTITQSVFYPSPPLKKCGVTNKHHIIPKSRGGKMKQTIRLDIMKHNAWHFLFANKTFTEVAELLLRADRAAKHKVGILGAVDNSAIAA